jgi:hypothetical protein
MTGSHFTFSADQYQLPLPPDSSQEQSDVMEVYVRFMRHLRCVPSSHPSIKILSAIQFTADIIGSNDAQVAKALVDLGLRAPRKALPATFLEFADLAVTRDGWQVGAPNDALKALVKHWRRIGEDPFDCTLRDRSMVEEGAIV